MIQQMQKFLMDGNDPGNARNVCFFLAYDEFYFLAELLYTILKWLVILDMISAVPLTVCVYFQIITISTYESQSGSSSFYIYIRMKK